MKATYGAVLAAFIPITIVTGVLKYHGLTSVINTFLPLMLLSMGLVLCMLTEPTKSEVADEVDDFLSLSEITAKLKVTMEATEAARTLQNIRKKIHADPSLANPGASSQLLDCVLNGLRSVRSNDKRMSPALDVINELLGVETVKKHIQGEDGLLKDTIDGLLVVYKEVFQSALSASKSILGVDSTSSIEQDELYSDMRPFEEFQSCALFRVYGYKMLITLGQLCDGSVSAQTKVVDRGGLDFVFDVIRKFPSNPAFQQWGCWACINMSITHPPNKREFVTRGGLILLMKAMKKFTAIEPLVLQTLSLLCVIISDDKHAKMGMAQVRQSVMADGVTQTIEEVSRNFPGNQNVQDLCNSILKMIFSDYS